MVRRKGFTLIELLVVISIIAMLLAILMPALGMVKEKARNVVCRTNLRQLSFACRMYADDHSNKLFSYLDGLYINLLSPYVDDEDSIRYCPSVTVKEDKKSPSRWGQAKKPWIWTDGVTDSEFGTYAMNGWTYTDRINPSTGDWVLKDGLAPMQHQLGYSSLSQVRRGAVTPFFVDSVWVDLWAKSISSRTDSVPPVGQWDISHSNVTNRVVQTGSDNPTTNHIRRAVTNRHGDNSNVAFVDGHVDGYKLADLWTLQWHRGWNTVRDMKREDGSAIYQR